MSAETKTTFTKAGDLVVNAGDHIVELPVNFRPFNATTPFGSDSLAIPRFTAYMMDKRAPGVYTAAVAGASSKLERLAEMAVETGTVGAIARAFLRHDLISRVNEQIVRSNFRVKQGQIVVSYPALTRIVSAIIDGTVVGPQSNPLDAPALRAVSGVITELLARAYAKFGMILPYKAIMHQAYYERPLATTSDILVASQIQTVTEVFESLAIGASLKEKEFVPSVIEALLNPMLVTAANRLLASEKYNRWMRDAAAITALYLRNDNSPVVQSLRDDPNLAALAANGSFAFEAMMRPILPPPASPVHEHSELLEFAVVRIRELRRFETLSPEKLFGMYSVHHHKTPNGTSAGLFVHRNVSITPQVKALGQTDIGGLVMPLPAYETSPYMPMLNELVTAAFAGTVATDTAGLIARHLIVSTAEHNVSAKGQDDKATVLTFGVSPIEVQYLALSLAKEILISNGATGALSEVVDGAKPQIHYGMDDELLNYRGNAYYYGGRVYTSDPAEALLLKGRDIIGTQQFPSRPQVFADDMMDQLVTTLDPELYTKVARSLSYELPLLDGTNAQISLSLWSIVTGGMELPTHDQLIAIDRNAAALISSMLALAVVTNEHLKQSGPVGEMIGEQIATATHYLFSAFTKPIGFNRFQRTASLRVMEHAAATMNRDIRADLRSVIVQHNLAMRLAVMILMRMGLVPYGLHNDIVALVTDSKSIERAAASEAFGKMFATRYA